jgi:hypothetical protein
MVYDRDRDFERRAVDFVKSAFHVDALRLNETIQKNDLFAAFYVQLEAYITPARLSRRRLK